MFGHATPEALRGIADAARSNGLRPVIGWTVPLANAIQAIAGQEETGLHKGKLVRLRCRVSGG